MKYSLIILASFMFILISCSENSKKNNSASASPFSQSTMDSVYSRIRPTVQSFTVDNAKATVVKAANGTQLLIPADCFTTTDGDAVKGNVRLEVVEAFSLQDFITCDLATLSGDSLLISNGMMYVNAKSGDEILQIRTGSAIIVSMPTMGADGSFQMFRGDGRNWVADSTMTESEYAIPLPLDLLYPDGNKTLWACIQGLGEKNEKYAYLDTGIVTFTDKKIENTVIATEDFSRRLYLLFNMMQNMSFFVNRDYYFGDEDCFGETFNYDIWKVYYDHPDRSISESDSIARKMYIDYFNTNENKIAAFCNEVNIHKRTYYSNWTDTNYYFDFRKQSLRDWYMEPIKYFPSDSKEIKIINNHGVDLNADNTYDQLREKGIDTKEINELLNYNFRRQSKIRMYQRYKEIAANKEKVSKIYESTVFSISVMGWINCDRFFDDPSAGKAEMYVTDSSGSNLDYVDCSLVIPDLNVRLSAYPTEGESYSFTQKNGRYTRLPIGRSAVIVGVSIQNDSVFFASRKINIKDGLRIVLPMHHIPKEVLKDSLAYALK